MNSKPLTPEEVTAASKQFFELFSIVKEDLYDQGLECKAEDVLKSMEQICGLAQKLRIQKELESQPFGFNKKTE